MSINQTQLYDTLQGLTQLPDTAEFIYGFLDAYGFPKSTITQLRNGGTRNVAKAEGDVALKKQLYFHSIPKKASVHEAAENLKNSEIIRSQAIRFVIVTNFKELVAYDLKADERMETPFEELHQQYSFFLPLAGYEKSYSHSESVADVKAAEKMGRLFDLIREKNKIITAGEVHALNVFLTRLLFCFFAEDTSIFAERQFTTAINSTTREDGEDVADFLGNLFAVLNAPTGSKIRKSMPAHLIAFPYVNGGLFENTKTVPVFSAKSRRLLLECGTLDWSQINPDIFGSMFQAVIEIDQRSNLGQHYTSVTNIMKVIKPLFLDKLDAELERSRNSEQKLKALLGRLGRIKVFDPACGSGNFLIIAYKELRRFEMEVFYALNAVSQQTVMFMSGIKLTQFYGIEIDDFAHEIALLSMWLTEHQMNREFEAAFGYAEPMLPLKSSGNITHGNSLKVDWNDVCANSGHDEIYVIGNPPFLGYNARTEEQKNDMEFIFSGFKKFKDLDYVSCWFWIGAQYISGTNAELALVSTNSICQGEQVALLWPPILELGLHIHIAYQPFPWKNNARNNAGVHVTVIGLSAAPEKRLIFRNVENDLHDYAAGNISPYLLEGSNMIAVSRPISISHAPKMVRGSQPSDGGHLLFNNAEYNELISNDPEATQWVHRIYGADEFINGKDRWCLWLSDADMNEVKNHPQIIQRLKQVSLSRKASTNAQTRALAQTPHLFWQNNHPTNGQYILVPAFTSERRPYVPIGIMDFKVISNNKNYIIPNGGLFELGIISSMMHMDWMRAVCGRLKSDYGYSTGLVYNTFPWPDASDSQRKTIETLAETVLMERENYPDKTLAFLYDPDTMPHDLKAAHKALDVAVERLYRTRPFRDAPERLEHLFARYEKLIDLERVQQAEEASAKKVTRKTRKPKAVVA